MVTDCLFASCGNLYGSICSDIFLQHHFYFNVWLSSLDFLNDVEINALKNESKIDKTKTSNDVSYIYILPSSIFL